MKIVLCIATMLFLWPSLAFGWNAFDVDKNWTETRLGITGAVQLIEGGFTEDPVVSDDFDPDPDLEPNSDDSSSETLTLLQDSAACSYTYLGNTQEASVGADSDVDITWTNGLATYVSQFNMWHNGDLDGATNEDWYGRMDTSVFAKGVQSFYINDDDADASYQYIKMKFSINVTLTDNLDPDRTGGEFSNNNLILEAACGGHYLLLSYSQDYDNQDGTYGRWHVSYNIYDVNQNNTNGSWWAPVGGPDYQISKTTYVRKANGANFIPEIWVNECDPDWDNDWINQGKDIVIANPVDTAVHGYESEIDETLHGVVKIEFLDMQNDPPDT